MSPVESAASPREHGYVAVLPIAAIGVAGLLARPWFVASGAGLPGLALLYVALVAISTFPLLPQLDVVGRAIDEPVARLVHPATAVAVGAATLLVAHVAAGPVASIAAGGAAIGLNVVAAVSEEAFFRRFLYGALLPFGAPVAVLLSALVFALLHVPLYGGAVFWVDLGAGLLLGWQRWATRSWAAPAATHALANVLAVLR
jgi:membrane protease YdiL (CAAX protease family)